MLGIVGGASFINCYSVGNIFNASNVSVGYIGGLVGVSDYKTAGDSVEIKNGFCLGNEFASMYVAKGNLPSSPYLDEFHDFNCTGSNLQGYSQRLGEKFVEDSDGTHQNNPILAWQLINN